MPFPFDPKHWRDRAQEVRRLADGMRDLAAKEIILRIAADCKNLAGRCTDIGPPIGAGNSPAHEVLQGA
jgi:hypothetical protein